VLGEAPRPGLLGKPVPGAVAPGETVGRPVFGFTPPTEGCPVRGSTVGRPVRGSVFVPVEGKPVRGSVGAFVGKPVRGSVGGGSVVLGSDPGALGIAPDVDGRPVPGCVGDVIGKPVRGSMVDDGNPVCGVVVCAPAVATAKPSMPIASVVQTRTFMTYLPSREELSKAGAAERSG
jgi:hypothetical protein